MPLQSLWNGNVSIKLPAELKFHDLSVVYPIPDNQEVFISQASDELSKKLILEINEYSSFESLDIAAKYYWDDLFESNSALKGCLWTQSMESMKLYGIKCNVINLMGYQIITNLIDQNHFVIIFLSVIELPNVTSNIHVIYHAPHHSISDTECENSDESLTNYQQFVEKASKEHNKILKSLKISSWELFRE